MAKFLVLALLAIGTDALRGRTGRMLEPKSAYPAVKRLAEQINKASCHDEGDAWVKKCDFAHEGCDMSTAGDSWGQHTICTNLIEKKNCGFLSYGISSDYSFDTKLNKDYGCEGIGLDPTVDYPAQLPGTSVDFLKVGAPMLKVGGAAPANFKVQAPTIAKKGLNGTRVSVLKMDCEGCEYALAGDILKDDPKFLHSVDQFVLEAHVDKRFMSTPEHLSQYNSLLQLVEDAGLKLMDARFTGCGEDMEFRGMRPPILGPARKSKFLQTKVHEKCLDELTGTGYDCSLNCQNFLFARPAVN